MPADPPVSFAEKVKTSGGKSGGGYPTQISSQDLDKNFVFATIEVDEEQFEIEKTTGSGGHEKRILKRATPFPEPPTGDTVFFLCVVGGELDWFPKAPESYDPAKTYVLGMLDGKPKWIATEECD